MELDFSTALAIPPVERHQRIDDICRRFELAWENESRPRLMDYIADVAEEMQSEVLAELIAIDRQRRLQAGEQPQIDDYLAQSPAHAGTIRGLFGDRGADPLGLGGGQGEPWPIMTGFTVVREVDRGGMGIVYRAHDDVIGRDVAVKVLRANHRDVVGAVQRFNEEARIAGQLQHPGIPAVYQIGKLPDGRPFLAMKLIKGSTLAEHLKSSRTSEAPLSASRADLIPAFEKICQAVAYAHSRGVIHRDLKPQNVMVGAFGEVQVMDWGLAKWLGKPATAETTLIPHNDATEFRNPRADSDGSDTQAGSMLGTPAFMPPEQAAGAVDQVDRRADVFGLGAILCVVLTGEPPYIGANNEAIRQLAVRGKLQNAFDRLDRSGAEPEWIALAKKCLAAEPVDRFNDAGELAVAVAMLRAQADDRARRAELERAKAEVTIAEERKRRRVQLALAASLLVVLTMSGFGAWFAWQRAKEDELRRDRAAGEVNMAMWQAQMLSHRRLWSQAHDRLLVSKNTLSQVGIASNLTASLDKAQRKIRLLKLFDRFRLDSAVSDELFSYGGPAHDEYRGAFLDLGFDFRTQSVAELVDGLRNSGQIPSPSEAPHFFEAMDDWALHETDKGVRMRILEVSAELVNAPFRLAKLVHEPWREQLSQNFDDRAELERISSELRRPGIGSLLYILVGKRLQSVGGDGDGLLAFGLKRHPADFWLHYELGQIRLRARPRRYEETAERLRTALLIRPDVDRIHSVLGQCLLKSGRYSEAIGEYAKVMERIGDAQLALGNAFLDLGDVTDAKVAERNAIDWFRMIVEMNPFADKAQHQFNYGLVLAANHDDADAVESFKRSIEIDPTYPYPYNGLAWLHRRKNDFPSALTVCRQAIDKNPKAAWAHWLLGSVLQQQDNDTDSERHFRRALEIDPENSGCLRSFGILLFQQGEFGGAVAALRNTLRRDPTDPDVLDYLATAHYRIGDVHKAVDTYQKAIELDPKNLLAFERLCLALGDLKDVAGSEAAFRKAMEIDPNCATVFTVLGLAYMRNCRWAEAIGSFRKAQELDPTFIVPIIFLAELLRKTGDLPGAIAAAACLRELELPFRRGPFGQDIDREPSTLIAPRSLMLSERYQSLSARITDFESGTAKVTDPVDLSCLVEICRYPSNKKYGFAHRLLTDALKTNPQQWHELRFDAACVAVRLAAGHDAAASINAEKGRQLRQQALDWLTADLSDVRKRALSNNWQERQSARHAMIRYLTDPDLAQIRDAEPLRAMANDQRAAWEKFWKDVRDALSANGG